MQYCWNPFQHDLELFPVPPFVVKIFSMHGHCEQFEVQLVEDHFCRAVRTLMLRRFRQERDRGCKHAPNKRDLNGTHTDNNETKQREIDNTSLERSRT